MTAHSFFGYRCWKVPPRDRFQESDFQSSPSRVVESISSRLASLPGELFCPLLAPFFGAVASFLPLTLGELVLDSIRTRDPEYPVLGTQQGQPGQEVSPVSVQRSESTMLGVRFATGLHIGARETLSVDQADDAPTLLS